MNVNRIVASLVVSETEKQKKYREYFTKKMEKWEIDSPASLSDEDKKKFFNEVDKDWSSEEE